MIKKFGDPRIQVGDLVWYKQPSDDMICLGKLEYIDSDGWYDVRWDIEHCKNEIMTYPPSYEFQNRMVFYTDAKETCIIPLKL